jgi:hypothetical protein
MKHGTLDLRKETKKRFQILTLFFERGTRGGYKKVGAQNKKDTVPYKTKLQ